MTQDTVAVYEFVEKLINDFVNLYLLQLQKIHYFSDGSCAQYKNYKNFANLIFHVQDFRITAEWNFFAASLWKNLCDVIGGTVKCLATRASLQRPLDNQILIPYQLFEFASQDISVITSFYINSETIRVDSYPWPMICKGRMYQRYQEPSLKGVPWGWFVFLGVFRMGVIHISPMLTTISLIPTEWILTISHLVHIMLANMTMICISVFTIRFPWNMVTLMWN